MDSKYERVPLIHKAHLENLPLGSTVLELGCSTGYMTQYMKEVINCKVFAIEIDIEAAKEVSKFCEKIIVGDLNQGNIFEEFKDIKFDAIVFE